MNFTKRTSTTQLYSLAKKLKLNGFHICRPSGLKSALKNDSIKSIVMNLDDYGTGTHWIAIHKPSKTYFDSYAQASPSVVPRDYKRSSTTKELQSIDSEMCGGLSVLWLHYKQYRSNSEFYDMFSDVY